jgi:hypothetical protein
MTMSSLVVPPLPAKSQSMHVRSSRRSTKPPAGPPSSNGSVTQGGRPYLVEVRPQVAKTIAEHGGPGAKVFRPSIGALIDDLETNPKRHPKKRGELKTARAAPLRYADGISWRAVYVIDEHARLVTILSLGPHDEAYEDAKRRI